MSFYKSSRALDEIETGRIKETTKSFGLSKILTGSISRTVEPGFQDQVDYALGRSRKKGRAVLTDPWDTVEEGQILDLHLSALYSGIMPFLRFGDIRRGENISVAAFWAHGYVAPFQQPSGFPDGQDAAGLHLVLVGSLDNVCRASWASEVPDAVGHEYPSDPGFLSSFIAAELGLDSPHVRQHIYMNEKSQNLEPGDRAAFAWRETSRASKGRAVSGPDIWIRQHHPATRVVATVVDITPDPVEGAERVVLARPVLIQDLA
ncbi:hypothetical protein L1785_18740 [Antribacter sp. KLBMP9083]|uniref:Uncharacterized protein n=1 Tax=Antribacter soli TaxID=2910976 RepID=A0AA41UAT0_9MICO|nr:hypothetical protein [Antribacter soli]MCF4123017.1 hypothetical protein [Antribacter soli]